MMIHEFLDPKATIRVENCPFCGGAPDIVYKTECGGHGEYYRTVKVFCTKCHASTRHFVLDGYYGSTESELDAIAAWNERVK